MRTLLAMWVIFIASAAQAQSPSVYLEDLTWTEVKAALSRGADIVIIPTGGTEQNGPAIVIGKHNRIVQYTSGEIARRLGNALVAPVMAYVPEGRIDPPQGHMMFAGTISLREETFAALLEDAARSLKQSGFKYICFIGDSGGNQQVQQQVADRLNREWKKQDVTVLHVGDYYAHNAQNEWVESKGLDIPQPDAHGGFMDASELLAVEGEQAVRRSALKPYDSDDYASHGSAGDASAATAENGKALLALKINAAVKQIRQATGMPDAAGSQE